MEGVRAIMEDARLEGGNTGLTLLCLDEYRLILDDDEGELMGKLLRRLPDGFGTSPKWGLEYGAAFEIPWCSGALCQSMGCSTGSSFTFQ